MLRSYEDLSAKQLNESVNVRARPLNINTLQNSKETRKYLKERNTNRERKKKYNSSHYNVNEDCAPLYQLRYNRI